MGKLSLKTQLDRITKYLELQGYFTAVQEDIVMSRPAEPVYEKLYQVEDETLIRNEIDGSIDEMQKRLEYRGTRLEQNRKIVAGNAELKRAYETDLRNFQQWNKENKLGLDMFKSFFTDPAWSEISKSPAFVERPNLYTAITTARFVLENRPSHGLYYWTEVEKHNAAVLKGMDRTKASGWARLMEMWGQIGAEESVFLSRLDAAYDGLSEADRSGKPTRVIWRLLREDRFQSSFMQSFPTESCDIGVR